MHSLSFPYFTSQARYLKLGHFVQIFWFQGEVLGWVSLLSIYSIHLTSPSAKKKMFEPVGRLCLPRLPLAYSMIFLYACELWTLTAEFEKRMQAFEMRCYQGC